MIFRHAYAGGIWVDLERPTDEEIRSVAKEFSISERVESELISPTPFPIVSGDTHSAFLVLHFPAPSDQEGQLRDQEIDILMGKAHIITVRYEVISPIHQLQRLLDTEAALEKQSHITTAVFLEILFAHLYTAVRDHTNHIAAKLTHIEDVMFHDGERKTVRAISGISRNFLHLEAAIANQEEPLRRFLTTLTERGYFGNSFNERALRIAAERQQVSHLLRTHRAVAVELRETNSALLEARQNEIMKTFTMITVVVLPLELIAFVFGMHAPGTPLESDPQAFWIIMAIMLGAVGIMALYFARRRWL